MKVILIVLGIIVYMIVGFCLSITFAKNWRINEKEEAAFLFIWPFLLITAVGELALEWLTKMAQKLSEKLPK